MRKEIDLPETTINKLQKLADKDGRKLKPYMERILILHTTSGIGIEGETITSTNKKRKIKRT